MAKKAVALFCLLLFFALYGCGTEVDRNPTPIVWGGVTFFPKTIERGYHKTVWNEVDVVGYDRKGHIKKVVITPGETVVEDIKLPNYEAQKQIFKDVQGDYKQAFNLFMSGKIDSVYDSFGQNNIGPKIKIGSYESENEKGFNHGVAVQIESVSGKDLSFAETGKIIAKKISVIENGQTKATAESASIDKLFVPDDVEHNSDKLLIDNFAISDIVLTELNGVIEKFYFNYDKSELKTGLENMSLPAATLALFGLPELPMANLKGSFTGEGKVRNNIVTADADLVLANLLTAKGNIIAPIHGREVEKLTISITDKGILNILPKEIKAQLAVAGLFIPGASAAIGEFLSMPGHTLTGVMSTQNGREEFSFSVK